MAFQYGSHIVQMKRPAPPSHGHDEAPVIPNKCNNSCSFLVDASVRPLALKRTDTAVAGFY